MFIFNLLFDRIGRPLVKSEYSNYYFFLFLEENICCGYSKELSR